MNLRVQYNLSSSIAVEKIHIEDELAGCPKFETRPLYILSFTK